MIPTDLRSALRAVTERLAAAGVSSPQTDATLLAAHVLALSPGELSAAAVLRRQLSRTECAALETLTLGREQRIPVQHLTGSAAFRSLNLAVGPGVFVPRPETEVTAQLAIDFLRTVGARAPLAVDLCTGSGAIALALATEVATLTVFAVEVSPSALEYARENLARTGLAGRVQLVAGDARTLLTELAPFAASVDVVTCNPPYIPPDGVPIEVEVRDHDPELALYGGGDDGLDLPLALAARALTLLRPGGLLVLEHADGQWPVLARALTQQGWLQLADHGDLAGRSRVATGVAPAANERDPGPRVDAGPPAGGS